ncbi:hypothetical protein SAMN04244573_03241 [Azotobacter beijerinckii]|uniref:Uncharacterized protein n=1 Tax=Azotobacter beijerinckii TaxID=170623 RepID=A0A1H9MSA9_9GAMM|nr:hypothetical protein [Azotobacter beijerinckii]SER26305.1 hypothetical protein SAMN04244573_03241 [Azotobacter beijerinckii]
MPAKNTTASTKSLVSAPRPSARRSGKGEPPASSSDTAAVGNHTSKPASKDLVDFNFKVPAEFKKDFRTFCATHGLKGVQYMMEVIEKDMQSKGWAPGN